MNRKSPTIPLGRIGDSSNVASLRTPGTNVQSAVQHFAAGVIFCVVATELRRSSPHRHLLRVTILGFTIVVAVMLGMKWVSERREGQSEAGTQTSTIMLAVGADVALDGLLIGLAVSGGQKQGLLLTIGLVLEFLFLGVSCALSLAKDRATRRRVLSAVGTLAALILAAASVGGLAAAAMSAPLLDGVLTFGVAALLTSSPKSCCSRLRSSRQPQQTAMFFRSTILLFTLDMLI